MSTGVPRTSPGVRTKVELPAPTLSCQERRYRHESVAPATGWLLRFEHVRSVRTKENLWSLQTNEDVQGA